MARTKNFYFFLAFSFFEQTLHFTIYNFIYSEILTMRNTFPKKQDFNYDSYTSEWQLLYNVRN